jgi:hypothetical protein
MIMMQIKTALTSELFQFHQTILHLVFDTGLPTIGVSEALGLADDFN